MQVVKGFPFRDTVKNHFMGTKWVKHERFGGGT